MASIIKRDGTRGATWRVVWRTQNGAQRSKTFEDRTDARRFRRTLEALEQAEPGRDYAALWEEIKHEWISQ